MSLAGVLDSRLTFSRPSNATMFNSQGRMVWAPANMIRNSGMAGAVLGSPGTLPTWWSTSVAGALRPQVVGLGTEGGIDYIDIRVAGTPANSNDEALLFFEDPATIGVAAFIGQRMTGSAYYRLLSGSFAGLRYIEHQIAEYNGGTWLDNSNSRVNLVPVVSGASLSSQRVTTTRTLNQPTANTVTIYIAAGFAVGVPVDFTLRVGLPQLERTGPDSPKAPIRTTGAAFYGPRFDTNPLTLQPRGLLIEPSSTNIIVHNSEVLRLSGGWEVEGNITTSTSTPDLFQNGTFTAFTSTNTPNACRLFSANLRATVGAGWVNGQPLTATVYMRRGTADGYICFDDGGGAVYACCRVNLTGAGTVAVTGSGADLIGTVERINNDTYRVRITYAYNTAQSTVRVSVGVWNTTNYIANYPECSTNGQTVHAWGVQLETMSFPTSYIPRLAANVSRALDECTAPVTGWYSTPQGSWSVEAEFVYNPGVNGEFQTAAGIRDAVNNDRMAALRFTPNTQGALELLPGGGLNEGFYPGTLQLGINRWAVGFDQTASAYYAINTPIVGTIAGNGGLPPPLYARSPANTGSLLLYVGAQSVSNTSTWNGWVRHIRWWQTRLPSATILQLVTP